HSFGCWFLHFQGAPVLKAPLESTRFYRTGLCPVWSKRGAGVVPARGSFSAAHVAGKTELNSFALSGKLCEA
ncbi:MAG: hypothetical protein IJI27_00240, partial [Oscillospiraceae bacterium]|nr:hypothetical protein [Oscillospiraceae bacterium]